MIRSFRALIVLAALGLAGCAAAAHTGPSIGDAESLIAAMHGGYADGWYHTLSLTQTTTRVLANDSIHAEEWREWAAIPGRLRIEMGAPAEGRVVIYARDSTYTLQHGRVVRRSDRMNPLMTLGFEVYRQAPERTLAQLQRQGFDVLRFHVDTLEGTPVYVVGAERGDTTSRQFTVEADRLLFVRLLEPSTSRPGVMQHVWFRRYEPLGGGWIAPEVEILVGGRRVFHAVYSDIRANDSLDAGMFAIPAS
jgi:outer membrane lipoprotein-sorting protein